MVEGPRRADGCRHGRLSFFSRGFGAVETRGIYESWMEPFFPRVRWKFPPLNGLYPPWAALCSSIPFSDYPTGLGFLTMHGGIDPIKLPRSMEV